jgi:hypothetical protein
MRRDRNVRSNRPSGVPRVSLHVYVTPALRQAIQTETVNLDVTAAQLVERVLRAYFLVKYGNNRE